jgi:hypothetical protein
MARAKGKKETNKKKTKKTKRDMKTKIILVPDDDGDLLKVYRLITFEKQFFGYF